MNDNEIIPFPTQERREETKTQSPIMAIFEEIVTDRKSCTTRLHHGIFEYEIKLNNATQDFTDAVKNLDTLKINENNKSLRATSELLIKIATEIHRIRTERSSKEKTIRPDFSQKT